MLPGPDVIAQVQQAREQHLTVLLDQIDVYRPTTKTDNPNPFEPRTSQLVKTTSEPLPALVQSAQSLTDQSVAPGAEDLKIQPYIVKVPCGSDVRTGDWLRVTACVLWPELVGTDLRALNVQDSSLAVVARIRAARAVPARIRP